MTLSTVALALWSVVGQAAPVWSQSLRFPTEAEQQQLLQDMRQDLPERLESEIYTDRRTPEQRQQAAEFSEAWAEVDEAIAPFLGEWFAIEESLAIYPSPHRGVVCIIDTYLDESNFYMGFALNGHIYTTTNMVLMLDSGFLVSTFVLGYGEVPDHYEYANPRRLQHPADLEIFAQMHPTVVEQFQQAGCKADMPMSAARDR